MELLAQLRSEATITTGEALLLGYELSNKYNKVLSNVLRIKTELPVSDTEGFARSKSANVDLLKSLQVLLETLKKALQGVEEKLSTICSQKGMNIEKGSDPACNREVLLLLDQAIDECHQLYEGKARSFAVILSDLESLSNLLHQKLTLREPAAFQVKGRDESETNAFGETIDDDEKLVYVRLFHKAMASLALPKSPKGWVRSLLESIKTSEKHGLAIYATEEDVKASLRGDSYGYATLCIKRSQDLTDKRKPREDPQLHCPLLTIGDVTVSNLIKFTYGNVDYPVKDGRIIWAPPEQI